MTVRKILGADPGTNKWFALTDEVFRRACELAKLPATSRQASKYRAGRGTAYKFRAAAVRAIQEQFAGVKP